MSEFEIPYEDTEEYEDEQFRNHFVIEDDQTAEWAMQQIRLANEEKAKWKQFYDERYQRVCNDADRTIANMESILQTYFESVPHKVTATQENYALPSGKLVIKRQSPEYQRTDEEVIEWLKANGGQKYVVTKEALDWANLKRSITVVGDTVADADGQIMPIKVVQRPDIFKVELKKEDNNG